MKKRTKIILVIVTAPLLFILIVFIADLLKDPPPVTSGRVFEVKGYLSDYEKVPKVTLVDFKKGKDILLSEIVADFQMVYLDSGNPNALLGAHNLIYLSENYIGVSQSGEAFRLYNKKTGKLIRTIGAIGRGPGEYMGIYDVIIKEDNNRIYINPFAKSALLEYTLDGDFIRKIEPPIEDRKIKYFLQDSTLTALITPFPKDTVMAVNLDLSGKILSTQKNLVGGQLTYSNEIISSKIGLNTSCFIMSSPVFYNYDFRNDSLSALFALDMADFEFENNPDIATDTKKYFSYPNQTHNLFIIALFEMGVIGNDANAHTKWLPTGDNLVMNKQLQQKQRAHIVNDFMFGLTCNFNTSKEGEYFELFPAITLKEKLQQLSEEALISSEQKQQIIQLATTIQETDNHILFYGKLRN